MHWPDLSRPADMCAAYRNETFLCPFGATRGFILSLAIPFPPFDLTIVNGWLLIERCEAKWSDTHAQSILVFQSQTCILRRRDDANTRCSGGHLSRLQTRKIYYWLDSVQQCVKRLNWLAIYRSLASMYTDPPPPMAATSNRLRPVIFDHPKRRIVIYWHAQGSGPH